MSRSHEQEIRAHAKRATEALEAAQLLLGQGFYDSTASRAYYAAFHIASAALLWKGETFKTHSSVLSGFHRIYVKSGHIDVRHGKALNQLFELRGIGDYGEAQHVSSSEAEYAVQIAGAFVRAVRAVIEDDA